MDAKYGCGEVGNTTNTFEELWFALFNRVTCIKLLPQEYFVQSILPPIGHSVAIVAEQGRATLDGGGARRILDTVSGPNVSLFNLTLTNGYSVRPPLPRSAASPQPLPYSHGNRLVR